MTCLQPVTVDLVQPLMDRSSRDVFPVPLQRKESPECPADGVGGSPCQGQGSDGARGRQWQNGQPVAGDGVGRSPAGDADEAEAVQGRRRDEGACPGRGGDGVLAAEMRRVRVWDPGRGEAGEPAGASCGFGPSLCFAADGGGQVTEGGEEGGGDGGEPVVDSQRQINNSGLQEEAEGKGEEEEGKGEEEEGEGEEEGEAPRWSLEPGGGMAGGEAPGEGTAGGGAAEGGVAEGGAPGEGTAGGGTGPEPDLVIEVAGCRIRAHKAVLCACSEYFRARRSRQVVRVRGVGLPAMRALLDHAYGERLRAPTLGGGGGGAHGGGDVDPEAAAALLAAAHALQMPGAARAALRAVRAQLRVRACGQLLALAKRQRVPELGEVALAYMSEHYLAVLRDPAVYGRLSAAERELILRRREAGARCLVAAELSDVYERPAGSRESSRPQSPERAAEPGDAQGGGDARWLYRLQPDAGGWRRLSRVPAEAAEARGCAVCALHGYLFLAGGTRGRGAGARPSPRVFAYNPATGGWAEARAMAQARSQLALATLDGLLYALGGECVLGVERYDPRADRWRPAAPLPRGAFAVGPEAAPCAGRLYLTGGSLSARLLAYEPRRDQWEECPPSPGAGRVAGLAARAPWLYRLELDREQRALGLLRYNTAARRWLRAACLRPAPAAPLPPFRCAPHGPHLYCVGRAAGLRLRLPGDGDGDGDGEEGEDGGPLGCRPLPGCTQAQGPLVPVFLPVPERPQDRP